MNNNVQCLVLNQNYEPLATVKTARALSLAGRGKAEVLAHGVDPIITPSCSLDRPSVIRLINMVRRPRPKVRFTRREVFRRDNSTCLYCGKQPRDLTIDHVIPVSRGGEDSWLNCVTSCRACNHRKGSRTPEEAHMVLRQKPYEPRLTSFLNLTAGHDRPEWSPYFPAA